MTYIQFSKRYTSSNKKPSDKELISYIVSRNSPNPNDKKMIDDLNVIVTDTFEAEMHLFSLPKVIMINEPIPGEPKYMRLRSARVIRLHKHLLGATAIQAFSSQAKLRP